MRIRTIDAGGDWTFGTGRESYKVDQACILQNARTKLLEFLNDCFFNMAAGVDWIRLMRQKNTENQIALSCRSVLLQTEGINEVTSISVAKNGRRLSINFTVNTIYSTGVISQVEVLNV